MNNILGKPIGWGDPGPPEGRDQSENPGRILEPIEGSAGKWVREHGSQEAGGETLLRFWRVFRVHEERKKNSHGAMNARAEEAPAGVLEMVTIYVATKASLSSVTKWPVDANKRVHAA